MKKKNKGFTVVELLSIIVVIVICAIIILPIIIESGLDASGIVAFSIIIFAVIAGISSSNKKQNKSGFVTTLTRIPAANNLSLKCFKCGNELKNDDKFCFKCGMPIIPANATVKCKKCGEVLSIGSDKCSKCKTEVNNENVDIIKDDSPVVSFNIKYYADEKNILKSMLKEEMKIQDESVSSLSTKSLNIKRNILLTIFGIITLISALLYFLNYSLILCTFIEVIAIIVYIIMIKKWNILNTLVKISISKPDYELSKIVSDAKNEKTEVILPYFLKNILVIFFAIFIPSIIFFQPKILYTRYGDGYQVFRYTNGIVDGKDSIVIPSTHKDKKVIAIGENAFKNTKIKNVTIPSGIESIKSKAFYNAKNIENIELPSTVVEIRGEAFAYMSNLSHITLPEGLKEIRGGAFAHDINLTNVNLPNSLEYIGGSAFSHCSSITEITVPKGVTEINGQTFEYMTSLKTINLHEGITYIHGEVFVGDTSLDNVKLPSKITEIKGNTFENCKSLSSIEIPEGVTRIGGHAFYGCTRLSYVYVPKTVNEIGSSAFRQCYSLHSITISRSALVNERAFKESPTVIHYYEDGWSSNQSNWELPIIGDYND